MHTYTHVRARTHKHTRTRTHTHSHTLTRCSCYLMAWTTATSEIKSSFPVPVIHSHVHQDDVCVSVCVGGCTFVCEFTFAPALWLMPDQSLSDPITRVWQARVVCVCLSVRVCVMERIILELPLVSSTLYHCGVLLSGKGLCYITHTCTYTHIHRQVSAQTHTQHRFVLIVLWGHSTGCIRSLFLITTYVALKE